MEVINATAPAVVPAIGEKVFDQWSIKRFVFDLDQWSVRVVLNRSRMVDGKNELMVGADAQKVVVVDLSEDMAETPEVPAAMNAVLGAVVAYCTKHNML